MERQVEREVKDVSIRPTSLLKECVRACVLYLIGSGPGSIA
jgi:hypothetical protein